MVDQLIKSSCGKNTMKILYQDAAVLIAMAELLMAYFALLVPLYALVEAKSTAAWLSVSRQYKIQCNCLCRDVLQWTCS